MNEYKVEYMEYNRRKPTTCIAVGNTKEEIEKRLMKLKNISLIKSIKLVNEFTRPKLYIDKGYKYVIRSNERKKEIGKEGYERERSKKKEK